MKFKQIATIIEAQVLSGEESLEREAESAFASDMMSDVLAYSKDQTVLLTGLVNPQSVRTAMMLDMCCLIFVRGKLPQKEAVELAESSGIVVMATSLTMYEACGRLYAAGLHLE